MGNVNIRWEFPKTPFKRTAQCRKLFEEERRQDAFRHNSKEIDNVRDLVKTSYYSIVISSNISLDTGYGSAALKRKDTTACIGYVQYGTNIGSKQAKT